MKKVFIILLATLALTSGFASWRFQQNEPPGLNTKAKSMALKAYKCLNKRGLVKNKLLTIVDFTQPSNQKRLYIINPKTNKLLANLYVAQGKGSGLLYAKVFSNRPNSDDSSLGAYLTLNSYYGKHGLSLRLKGLEPDINSNAFKRDIVMHSAWYVSKGFLHKYDRLGRSWGCFAISQKQIKRIINLIKNGSVLFAYAKQEDKDSFLNHC